jgi:drug/metabolite transporter (DMT)-like permease
MIISQLFSRPSGISKKFIPLALLLSVSVIWGSTFAIMKDSLDRLNVDSFLAWRFIIAALLMAIVRPQSLRHINLHFLIRGVIIGLILGTGYILQTFGLTLTSVAKTGFITGLYAIFTPLIAAGLFKHSVTKVQWLAVVLSMLGLAILALKGLSLGLGEFLVVLSALFFALHIIALSRWSPGRDAYALTIIQMATVGVLALISTAKTGLHAPHDKGMWVAIIYTAIFASAFAFMVQTWTQSFMSATSVGIILTMEYVFAAVFGILLVHEHLTLRVAIGGTCMMIGLYLAILFDGNENENHQSTTERKNPS